MTAIRRPPLRFGILGCARVAHQFARDVLASAEAEIVAVASREAAKAAAFGDSFAVQRRYSSYEALIEDPYVEAVYIPLPNSMHAEWSVRAAQKGKHILCEKPLALDTNETRLMFNAARQHGVLLVEAYPYWFQPQTIGMMAMLRGNLQCIIGDIRSIHISSGFTIIDLEANIRGSPSLGGGALMDAGCYNLSLICMVMGCAPIAVRAEATWTETGVDISTMATLRFSDGRRAQMSCAMDTAPYRRAIIVGADGVIETEFLNHTSDGPQHPYHYLPSEMRLRKGTTASAPFKPVCSPTGSGFRFTAEAFSRMAAERDGESMDRLATISVDVARTMDAIKQSSQSGEEVAVMA